MARRPPIVDKRGIFGRYPGQKRQVVNRGDSFYTGLPLPKTSGAPPASGTAPPADPSLASGGAPSSTAMPWDTLWERGNSRIQSQLDMLDPNYEAAKAQTVQQYGLEDASDPYARARLLEHSYAQNQRATNTGLSARGQLYSGAMQNQVEGDRYNYDQSSDALKKEYQGVLQGLIAKREAARTALEDQRDTGDWNRLATALANPPDTAPLPTSGKPADYKGLPSWADPTGFARPGRTPGVYQGAPRTIISASGARIAPKGYKMTPPKKKKK